MHKLKELRQSEGLSQQELSELSEISQAAICRIEKRTGSRKTHYGVAEALADAFGVPVDALFDKSELTHLGRPPHTGKPTTPTSDLFAIKSYETVCLCCRLVYNPRVRSCCENQVAS